MTVSNPSLSGSEFHAEPIGFGPLRVSWGAILAGLVVTLGAWVLLTVLGLALGLSAADPANPAGSLRSVGAITSLWSLVVPFVALLFGGLVAARTAGVVSRPTGAVHGVVLWALATLMSLVLLGYMVRGVVSTAAGLGSGIASAASAAVAGGAARAPDLAATLGVTGNDVLGPVNSMLADQGKPPISVRQLDAAMREVVSTGVRQGFIDHDLIVTSLARNTALSPADAEDVAQRVESTVEQRRRELGQGIQTGAARAADTTGKAMWWVFFGMLLGLGASVLGSTLGVSRKQRIAAKVVSAPPLTGGHEPSQEPSHEPSHAPA